ncbi:MAG: hypothetical protein HY866_08490 [Chloroflexi bacterium]|nr:hypothetical protein [Chloroflexota bacterium]
MQKFLKAGMLAVLVVLSMGLTSALSPSHAQSGYTPQDAIDLAAAHAAFVDGLAARPGWTAAAYDSKNSYGIWHVQFWDTDGEDLGWADLSLERSKVYSWEVYMGLTEEQSSSTEETIRAFLLNSPDVVDLVENLGDADLYVDYDYWNERWGAYIELGPDSLYVTLRSTSGRSLSLENLQLDRIYFSELPSYDEWFSAQEAQAISIAFQQPEINAALRDYSGWAATGEPDENGVWHLTFTLGEQTLATAAVMVETQQVLEFTLGG